MKPSKTQRRAIRLVLLAILFVLAALQTRNATTMPQAPSASPTDSGTVAGAIQEATSDALKHQPGLWHVTSVVDGDTIDVAQGTQKERVRLIGVDTPETHDPRKPVQCFGEAAAAYTKQLLQNKDVRLAPDPENSDRDKYQRLLRYVYLPNGTLVNARLIADGYGFAYVVFPFTKLEEFRALEAQARQNNQGLWAGCNVNDSKAVKQTTSAK